MDRPGGSSYQPHTSESVPDEEIERDEAGDIVGPHVRSVAQRPRAEEIGEVEGKKGKFNSFS